MESPGINKEALIKTLAEISGASYDVVERKLTKSPFERGAVDVLFEKLLSPVPLPGSVETGPVASIGLEKVIETSVAHRYK